jgi:hypothetical protein
MATEIAARPAPTFAVVVTEYFGGAGGQAAVVSVDGRPIRPVDNINSALRVLEVVAAPGSDESLLSRGWPATFEDAWSGPGAGSNNTAGQNITSFVGRSTSRRRVPAMTSDEEAPCATDYRMRQAHSW